MLGGFWRTFNELLHPRNCHLCRKLLCADQSSYDEFICGTCAAKMRRAPICGCAQCGDFKIGEKQLCQICSKNPPPFERLIALFVYEDSMRELIRQFKYHSRPYLLNTLLKLIHDNLDDYVRDVLQKADAYIAIPLHPSKLREREYNQADLLAQALSRTFDKPLFKSLKRRKNTRPQALLSLDTRRKNLLDAFYVDDPNPLRNKHLLLIDDVVTSTSTVRCGARALKSAQAKTVSVLALARG